MLTEDRYSLEVRVRAVRMVSEVRERTGRGTAAVASVAGRLGIDPRTLQSWVAQTEAADRTNNEGDEIVVLTRRIRDLQRENDILRAASHFFARELDPRHLR